MKILFLTCDVVRSYEHSREHVAECKGISQYLQPAWGLHLSPGKLHVCDGVPIRKRGPVHQVHRHRCNHGLKRHASQPPRPCPYVTRRRLIDTFGQSHSHIHRSSRSYTICAHATLQLVLCTSPRMMWHVHL
jgi:hypothetical protein